MSDLHTKLCRLRSQTGAAGENSIASRLQRVGMARRSSVRPRRVSDEVLASRLGGCVVREGVVMIRERLPIDAPHGEYPVTERGLSEALSFCSGRTGNGGGARVFMDTETTGLAGGTGTLVFLLGMARFTRGALEVTQLLLTGFQGESAMLEEARTHLRRADTLVTFNGRSFDGPLLASRYRLSDLHDPFAALSHVDLLHVTRRTFKKSWPDCRLQTVERRLLRCERSNDLPGAEVPQAWFDWIRHGRADRLPRVCAHNRLDLLSLVVLPAALKRSHDDPGASGADVLAWARHLYKRSGGDGEGEAFHFLARHRPHLDVDGLLELARLARRHREWGLAVELWKQLAANDVAVAIEHLAKYYEHEKKDLERALQLTAELIARDPGDRQYRRRGARLRARLAPTRY